MIKPQTEVSIIFCALCALSSLWLFAQGYVNLRTGKLTSFGLDAFWYFIDVQVRRFIELKSPSHWNDAKVIKKTGIMTVLLAFILAKTAFGIYLRDISMYIK
jgi:hypothetical protein